MAAPNPADTLPFRTDHRSPRLSLQPQPLLGAGNAAETLPADGRAAACSRRLPRSCSAPLDVSHGTALVQAQSTERPAAVLLPALRTRLLQPQQGPKRRLWQQTESNLSPVSLPPPIRLIGREDFRAVLGQKRFEAAVNHFCFPTAATGRSHSRRQHSRLPSLQAPTP